MPNEELTLNILRNIPELGSQKSLADKLGFSVGKINYILKALCEKGLVKAEIFFANKNKNQYKYLLTQKGIQEKIALTEKFIKIKKSEYNKLTEELKNMNIKKMENG